MESEEKSTLQKWLPSLKKPEYVGMPKTVWVDMGRISDQERFGKFFDFLKKLFLNL